MKREVKGAENCFVQKSAPLIEMYSVPFSLTELKIIDIYLSRINIADDTKRTVRFTKEEYEKIMKINCAKHYALDASLNDILTKTVTLEMPNTNRLEVALFEKANYGIGADGKAFVELTCSEGAKDLFFCQDKYRCFKYPLGSISKLSHRSSYLLYMYILKCKFKTHWTVDIDKLREILSVEKQESYKSFKVFRRSVLDPATEEVNEKTDCHFKYEPIYSGRKVVEIEFTYRGPRKKSSPSEKEQISADLIAHRGRAVSASSENHMTKGSAHLEQKTITFSQKIALENLLEDGFKYVAKTSKEFFGINKELVVAFESKPIRAIRGKNKMWCVTCIGVLMPEIQILSDLLDADADEPTLISDLMKGEIT